MTNDPSAPLAAHLTPDQLAELSLDLLPARDTAAVETHLRSCPSCQATSEALAGVPHLLAAAGPVSIPADVTARVYAALALEAEARSAEPSRAAAPAASPVAVPAGATISALDAARGRRAASSRLRRAGAVLVGVAAVLGGGFLFTQGFPSFSGSADEPTAADVAEGNNPLDEGQDGRGESTAGPLGTASGKHYSAATLVDEVTELIAQRTESPETLGTPPREASSPVDTSAEADQDTGSCVTAVGAEARSTAAPLAVDVGTYEGDPAVVVVLPLPRAAAAEADIWVVSADCLAADDASELEVLQRVPLAELPGLE